MFRKIEPKQVGSFEDLNKERWSHEPVLGKDSWLSCFGFAFWRMVNIHILTPSGAWVITSTVLGYRLAVKAFNSPVTPSDSMVYILAGFGLHAVLAWLWVCSRDEARNILRACGDILRGLAERAKGSRGQG